MKRYDKTDEIAYTIGVFPTLELLKHKPGQVEKVLVAESGKENEGVQEIRTICGQLKIPTELADRAVEKISGKGNSYAVGVFNKYEETVEKAQNHVVLVNPADMGNLGTMVRTALGLGFTNIAIIKPAADIFDPKTIRASMGAIFQMRWQYFNRLEEYLASSDNQPYLFMTNGKTSIYHMKFQPPFSLIFGSEAAGLPSEYAKYGETVRISQDNSIDSLNLAVAAAIGMYEAQRGVRE